mmetsp:Transcript_22783/g.52038  ORF Transcript_22783/g.52038 Transcript_22783/m.52038 type:complete len:274 (-) Transcript_22783:1398-2219(-)
MLSWNCPCVARASVDRVEAVLRYTHALWDMPAQISSANVSEATACCAGVGPPHAFARGLPFLNVTSGLCSSEINLVYFSLTAEAVCLHCSVVRALALACALTSLASSEAASTASSKLAPASLPASSSSSESKSDASLALELESLSQSAGSGSSSSLFSSASSLSSFFASTCSSLMVPLSPSSERTWFRTASNPPAVLDATGAASMVTSKPASPAVASCTAVPTVVVFKTIPWPQESEQPVLSSPPASWALDGSRGEARVLRDRVCSKGINGEQ